MSGQKLTKDQALQKVKQYCAYQERSHNEVKEKLYGYGLYSRDVDEVLATLITENYLNEERYAEAFAGGKFRMKSWGRIKISYELKQRGVSAVCIKKALAQIDNDDYAAALERLVTERWQQLKGETNIFIKKKKVQGWLLQKGFEGDMIREQLDILS